jgi:acetyl-CoA carboxylase biotin carboxylase subunit
LVPPLFHRLLVANRGEVAVRIARACDALGIVPVFAVSEADRAAPYTQGREVTVLGPARAAQSYLDVERVVQAAVQTRCSALHPGWGFLSENPLLATLCAQHGVTFVGPPPHVTALMGSKTRAKAAMRAAGLHLIPGSDGVLASLEQAKAVAAEVGFPVLFKAENGGGGRGMRIARSADQVETAYSEAQAEARAAFGGDRVFLEKLVEGGHHIEVQVFADKYGRAVHLGERDCTVQRNHQKLIEESPSPVLTPELRAATCTAAARAAAQIGYVGAGTMEMLLDRGVPRFMEMNCRLQVEHTVSEERTGKDLVIAQLEIAAGRPLVWTQDTINLDGHVIECRINAEDPREGFKPAPGTISAWAPPTGRRAARGGGIYDSLIAKVDLRRTCRSRRSPSHDARQDVGGDLLVVVRGDALADQRVVASLLAAGAQLEVALDRLLLARRGRPRRSRRDRRSAAP